GVDLLASIYWRRSTGTVLLASIYWRRSTGVDLLASIYWRRSTRRQSTRRQSRQPQSTQPQSTRPRSSRLMRLGTAPFGTVVQTGGRLQIHLVDDVVPHRPHIEHFLRRQFE